MIRLKVNIKDRKDAADEFFHLLYLFHILFCGSIPDWSGICMGVNMDKSKKEKQQQKKEHEKFNNITNKIKVENQNQTHNVVEEGIGPINQKR